MLTLRGIVMAGIVACLAAGTAAAQRGATGRGGDTGKPASKQQPAKPDTGKKSAAVSLDFQEQDLKVVLDAIAAAGDLNVSLTNIPSQRYTLHMGRPVTREGMIEVLKSVAEANNLKFTQTPTLIQIAGPPPEVPQRGNAQTAAQQFSQLAQQQAVRLYTIRLKHASAVQLAPVLTNLFAGANSGFAGGAGTTVFPNGNGGFNVIGGLATPPNNITTNGGVTTIPAPFGGNAGAGRGGAGRGGGGNAGGNAGGGGNNPFAQLATAFQQASGSLSNQAGNIRIVAEETSNSLLVRATESDFALVEQVVQGVDLRPLQVLIEVTIAEVQRTHDLDVGVSGSVKKNPNGQTTATLSGPSQASAQDLILELTGGHGTIKYDVAIAALQERGDVRVLSLPVIIAQNNRQAVLNVGSSRPFVQVSQTVPNDPTGRVQTVQYIDVGTVLTITPTINPDGYVNLQVQQTDNSATNEVQFDAPVISKREATTQVFIRDGQTTVIGGLADNTHSSDVSGIPFLSRIPIIGGFLFGQTIKHQETSELFLFLTPHIINSDEDIDKLRDALKSGSDLLQQMNIGPRIIPSADTIPRPRPDTIPRRPPADSMSLLRRRPPRDTLAWR